MRDQMDDQICRGNGVLPGSQDFINCRNDMTEDRREMLQLGAALMQPLRLTQPLASKTARLSPAINTDR